MIHENDLTGVRAPSRRITGKCDYKPVGYSSQGSWQKVMPIAPNSRWSKRQFGAAVSRKPPSTGRTIPVTNRASSLAR